MSHIWLRLQPVWFPYPKEQPVCRVHNLCVLLFGLRECPQPAQRSHHGALVQGAVSTGTRRLGAAAVETRQPRGAREGTRDRQRSEVKPHKETPELQHHKRRRSRACSCSCGSLLPVPTGISVSSQLFQHADSHRVAKRFGRDLQDHLKLKPSHT